jgi:hypothetical protein
MKKPLEKTLQNTHISLSVLQALADDSFDSVLVTDTTKAGKLSKRINHPASWQPTLNQK